MVSFPNKRVPECLGTLTKNVVPCFRPLKPCASDQDFLCQASIILKIAAPRHLPDVHVRNCLRMVLSALAIRSGRLLRVH